MTPEPGAGEGRRETAAAAGTVVRAAEPVRLPDRWPRPRPALGVSRAVALVVAGAGAAVLLTVWWFDTTLPQAGWQWVAEAGHVTGLAAGYGALLTVTVAARLPLLENGVGSARLMVWHRRLGAWTVVATAGHVVAAVTGSAWRTRVGPWARFDLLVLHVPDILPACVATALFVVIGVVSTPWVRRRLRYETWHVTHLYTYLAVGLSVAHVVVLGSQFVRHAWLADTWIAVHVALLAAVVWFRLLVPVAVSLRHELRVVEVVRETPDSVSVVIGGDRIPWLRAEPGHYFRWRFLTSTHWWASNPYSLSAPPEVTSLRITVAHAGDHSGLLREIHPGTRVFVEGPYGGLVLARRRHRRMLLIAAGAGVTPIRALFEAVPAWPGDIVVVYRVREAERALLLDELQDLARRRGDTVHLVAGSRAALAAGPDPLPLTASWFARTVPRLRHRDVFLCGRPAFVDDVTAALRQAGVRRRHIHAESFEG